MINFVRLQNDFAHLLLCDSWLKDVNIVTRHTLLDDESKLPDETLALEVLAYITPRNGDNGRTGCGIIVEVPEAEVPNVVSPGPEKEIIVTALVLEEPLANNGPETGTRLPADQVAQRILELGHGWSADDAGDFFSDRNAIQPATDFEPLRAFRVRVRVRHAAPQTERVSLPAQSIDENFMVSFAPPVNAEDANIYYSILVGGFEQPNTTTYPGSSNSKSTRYAGPFPVQAGDVVRWAAEKPGLLPSRLGSATINA